MIDWVTETVRDFGRTIGIPELALDEDGCVAFEVESDGILGVQDLETSGSNEVLISLAKPLPHPPGISVRSVLRMSDFRVNPKWQLQAAIRDADLVVTLRTPRHSFLLNALEEAIESLFDIHARVAQGA